MSRAQESRPPQRAPGPPCWSRALIVTLLVSCVLLPVAQRTASCGVVPEADAEEPFVRPEFLFRFVEVTVWSGTDREIKLKDDAPDSRVDYVELGWTSDWGVRVDARVFRGLSGFVETEAVELDIAANFDTEPHPLYYYEIFNDADARAWALGLRYNVPFHKHFLGSLSAGYRRMDAEYDASNPLLLYTGELRDLSWSETFVEAAARVRLKTSGAFNVDLVGEAIASWPEATLEGTDVPDLELDPEQQIELRLGPEFSWVQMLFVGVQLGDMESNNFLRVTAGFRY